MSDTETGMPTNSPINRDSLQTQNRRLYEHLAAGGTINFQDAKELGIPYLNSRIADLKQEGVPIYSRYIRIKTISCKEYSINPFEKMQGK